MANKKYVCIICPNSCEVEASISGRDVRVSGNLCRKGEEYVRKEVFSPERGLTTTIPVRNGSLPMVSVKTSRPIPKEMLVKVMEELSHASAEAPVKVGDILVKDVLGTGVNVVATKNVNLRTEIR